MKTKEDVQGKINEVQDLIDDTDVLINCCATGVDCRNVNYKFKMTDNLELASEMDIDHWIDKNNTYIQVMKALTWTIEDETNI